MTDPWGGASPFARMEERLERMDELRRRTEELNGEAETPDGQVRATVANGDVLASLHIDPRAMRMGSEALAESILDTVRRARENLAERAADAMTEVFGDEDPSAAFGTQEGQRLVSEQLARVGEFSHATVDRMNDIAERLRHRMGSV